MIVIWCGHPAGYDHEWLGMTTLLVDHVGGSRNGQIHHATNGKTHVMSTNRQATFKRELLDRKPEDVWLVNADDNE